MITDIIDDTVFNLLHSPDPPNVLLDCDLQSKSVRLSQKQLALQSLVSTHGSCNIPFTTHSLLGRTLRSSVGPIFTAMRCAFCAYPAYAAHASCSAAIAESKSLRVVDRLWIGAMFIAKN